MEAQWRLALWFLGLDDHPLCARLAQSLLDTQRPDGAWEIYFGAPNGDINTTVEAYAALRCSGFSADHPALLKAQDWIEAKGGLKNIRVFTRYWLALIGEWPWEKTPNLPPEVIWLPLWFPFNIYHFAQWARATLMPIAVLSARRPSRPLAAREPARRTVSRGTRRVSTTICRRSPIPISGTVSSARPTTSCTGCRGAGSGARRLREGAIRHVLEWIVKHQDADGAWGGIQPPWIYSLMALHTEGYALTHPVLAKGLDALNDPGWRVDVGEATFIQATNSPVWDTMLTLLAFDDAEALDNEATDKAVDWLLSRQVRVPGDWSVKLPGVKPGGWAFEYANNFYPDTDDTAVALIALAPFRHKKNGGRAASRKRSSWASTGWSPCKARTAAGAPSTRTIRRKSSPKSRSAISARRSIRPPSMSPPMSSKPSASWGCRPRIRPWSRRCATSASSRSPRDRGSAAGASTTSTGPARCCRRLAAIGEDMRQPHIGRACDWIVSRQQANGGWGESCASYMQADSAGRGDATASQTAWALMALLAANRRQDREAIERGCHYLLETQRDGTWYEPHYTGHGISRLWRRADHQD